MKKSLPWLFLILGIIFSTFLWGHISFPYDTSNTIIGQYSVQKINPLNDTIRGLQFIFFPILFYGLSFLIFNKEKITNKIFLNFNSLENRNIDYLSLILIFFSILEFLSLDYRNYLGSLDTHHEGTFLTAQLNFLIKNKIWTGSSFDYGFLGNSIGIIYSQLFNEYSIGIQRFLFIFLVLINKIFLILICRKIVISLNADNKKEILFLILSFSVISLASFYDHVKVFHERLFLFLIFLLLVSLIINSDRKETIISFLIGIFSILSVLFYWDIGAYINFLLLLFLAYLFLVKKFYNLLVVIFAIVFSWFAFYTLLPEQELNEFLNQYIFVINISDYLLGIEYPEPFSEKSTRHTKALLLIVFSGIFLINYLFNTSNKENFNSKFVLFFIFIASIVFFKSGLMRSDAPHIKYSSGLYTLLIIFFISYYLINFIKDFEVINKILIFFEKKLFLFSFTILICFLFFFQNNYLNLINIFNTEKNFLMLTNIKDKTILDKDYYEFIKIYKELTKNENCVQQFTDDNAIPYLVNKPTCTKYYASAHIIQNWTENNFIKELEETSPNYIVYSSRINWFKSRNNAPNADKFIIDNYFLYKDLSPWTIYKKR